MVECLGRQHDRYCHGRGCVPPCTWVCGRASFTTIDLGEVNEIARLYADDEHIGTRLWAPYTFMLPQGAKQLRVEIANTPAGKMDGVGIPSGLTN